MENFKNVEKKRHKDKNLILQDFKFLFYEKNLISHPVRQIIE